MARKAADNEILMMALKGYEREKAIIEAKIVDLRIRLGAKNPIQIVQPKRHTISAEGRARIAAAQRKRWAISRRAG